MIHRQPDFRFTRSLLHPWHIFWDMQSNLITYFLLSLPKVILFHLSRGLDRLFGSYIPRLHWSSPPSSHLHIFLFTLSIGLWFLHNTIIPLQDLLTFIRFAGGNASIYLHRPPILHDISAFLHSPSKHLYQFCFSSISWSQSQLSF